MSAERIAKRYATALFNLCEGDLDLAKKYRSAFRVISGIFENEDIKKVLSSPVVNPELKRTVLKDVSEQIEADKLLALFLDSIGEANRVGVIPEISTALHKLILKVEGIVEAEVLTVFDLDPESMNSVQLSLEKMTGNKVELRNIVDMYGKVSDCILGGPVAVFETDQVR